MGINVHDACSWLKTSPSQDDIVATVKKLDKKDTSNFDEFQMREFARVTEILLSAISDLESGDNVTSFRDLVDLYNDEDKKHDDRNKSTNNDVKPDLSPLIPENEEYEPLSKDVKLARFNELKQKLSS